VVSRGRDGASEIEPDAGAYRYGRSIVADYGGDLDRAVTMVGHSLGSTIVLYHGLDATLHVMEDANHFSPIFYDKVDGQ
jgi:hypothetical protein